MTYHKSVVKLNDHAITPKNGSIDANEKFNISISIIMFAMQRSEEYDSFCFGRVLAHNRTESIPLLP